MDAQQLAEAIVQATAVTIDPTATAQRRTEAVQFFEQVGNIYNNLTEVMEVVFGRLWSCCIPLAQHSLICCHSNCYSSCSTVICTVFGVCSSIL